MDEQLARYRAMRDFAMTAEPRGAADSKDAAEGSLPFVVQKHAATRLHYDFRLGWRGVLKSWAVTKGPSYNVKDKRLAVEVEDHPIAYGGFEGTIPKGQYGGGTVMVWDQGTWEPVVDVDEGLRKGQLKFILHGQKLKGHWALIRMKGDRFGKEGKPNWLLIKEHDEYERGDDDPAITEEAPDSAVTGRSLEEIASAEDHVWNSNAPEKAASKGPANRSRLTRRAAPAAETEPPDRKTILEGAPKEKMPEFISPELAITVTEPPEGDDWLHELKLDGYRIQAHIVRKGTEPRVQLFTRKGLDWTHRMRKVAAAVAELPVHSAILDGEVVVLTADGGTSFAELQAAMDEGAANPLTYFSFDLLHLDGHNLRQLPLERRKTILEGLLQERGEDQTLRYSSHFRTSGREFFQRACELGAEGAVSKLASAPYRSERTRAWLKSKCVRQQEFVIGGYTPLANGSHGIGALLLGYFQGNKLMYAGRTGTGFTSKMRERLQAQLEPLRQSKTAFHALPADAKKDAVWVAPQLVAEARFATWTGDHRVRQAAFLGMREDKDPKEVVREEAAPVPKGSRRDRASAEADDEPDRKNEAGAKGHDLAEKAVKHAAAGSRAAKQEKHTASAAKHASPATGSSRRGERAEVAGISISHPDKILDETSRLTKLQLAEYYAAVAEHLLPHIADRPLSIVRCPEGSGKPCFFQKHVGRGLPAGVDSVPVRPKDGGAPEEYLTLRTREGLVGLAQMGVLEVHPWGSRNESLEQPDRLIIDLDPDTSLPWAKLVESAQEVRGLLKHLGLESFVKTTGGKGLHVVVPIEPRLEWPAIKTFAHNFVLMMERANPDLYLTKMTKAARTGRIFLDYLRNERGATAVAPYSPRARMGVRVAMPLTWAEVPRTDPQQFGAVNYEEWKGRLKRDPWKKMDAVQQELTDRAIAAVAEMAGNQSA